LYVAGTPSNDDRAWREPHFIGASKAKERRFSQVESGEGDLGSALYVLYLGRYVMTSMNMQCSKYWLATRQVIIKLGAQPPTSRACAIDHAEIRRKGR
jgi:hypothetical protein